MTPDERKAWREKNKKLNAEIEAHRSGVRPKRVRKKKEQLEIVHFDLHGKSHCGRAPVYGEPKLTSYLSKVTCGHCRLAFRSM